MNLLERVISTVAPHECLVCGQEDFVLCPWCRFTCGPLPDRCYGCFAATENSEVCKKCRRITSLKHVWVATQYEDVAKRLVHVLKFERGQAAASDIAAMMIDKLPYIDENVLITHIPTATSRERIRGYDHAELIARQLAIKLERTHVPLLVRLGQTRQVGSKKADRQRQLQEAFRPSRKKVISNAHILLVDDVVTTGATLESAAQTLMMAGAKKVMAIAFTQKQ